MKRKRVFGCILAVGMITLGACGQKAQPEADPAAAVGTQETAAEPTEAPAATEAPTEAEAEKPTEAAAEPTVEETSENTPEDGVYSAVFDTDSSMFHVNEVCDGRGILTVEDGIMTMHIVLPSKNIVNLYYGLVEDAQKDGAELLQPVAESVTYPDGMTEEVYAFDIPVPYLDEEFDLALIGTKEVWYDHKVKVSDPVPLEETVEETEPYVLEDGLYKIEVSLEGGSGKATITSPTEISVLGGSMFLDVEWSSPNYDYMLIGEKRYDPINTSGNSMFLLTVKDLGVPLQVVADTVAMSEPHEIEYTINFDLDSIVKED